jgi:predicted AAA+ superfamily ATPase
MKQYISRLIETTIKRELDALGCVAIEGPKWCGKSTTGERFAKTVIKLQNPITYRQYTAFATTSKENLLRGNKPLMFDEWQKIPDIWDFIRTDIDETGLAGQYILTGSTKPLKGLERHSGTGRISKITMRPMSLWESGDSTGEVSLNALFNGNDAIFGKSKLSLDDLTFIVCRGGWPETVVKPAQALTLSAAYFKSLTTEDITDADGIKRNPRRAQAILRAYAQQISSFATNTTLQADVTANDSTIDIKTLSSYVCAFEKLFVIENITAWSPKLRSRSVIRTADKRQFVDPSIATIALGARPRDLIDDLHTFGFFFESLCQRDLRIYAQSLDGELYHYHDGDGLEVDAVVHLSNGRWGAIEIKVGGNQIDEAAMNLIRLKNKVAPSLRAPSFLMVLTGVPDAYKRPDGVLVVPIGCLRN